MVSHNDLSAEEFVSSAYRTYGEYTLSERAIPSLQDGLLPVQRRILYAMWKMGLKYNATTAKCAAIVGTVMGHYHPHGDASIYGALVNMVNPEMTCRGGDPRAPVDPQGNFGNPRPGEGDPEMTPPAAMRYTEARLSKIGTAMFDCLDVAVLKDNFDGTRQEPRVIPSRLPMLLMTGAYGVALGANTAIPPHHPVGLLKAARLVLRNPDATTLDVAKLVKGPDYGHSSLLSPRSDILEMYRTGKGTLYYVCDHHIEKGKGKDGHELIITSLAPGFLMKSFLGLCRQLEAEGKIIAFNDGTDNRGPRITVQFSDPTVVEERIIPKLRTFVSYNWNVQDESSDGTHTFMRIGLLAYISAWVAYRQEVEEAMLHLEAKAAAADLKREAAKLAGIQNIEVLAKILSDTKLSEEESNKLIKAKVKVKWGDKTRDLDDDQVQLLLEQKIRSLRGLNLEAQAGKVRALFALIKRIKGDLENLTDYVDARLADAEKLFPGSYKRGTVLLNGEYPTLSMPEGEGAAGFWCINKLGYVRSYPELPERKGKWHEDSWTVAASQHVIVVAPSGKMTALQSAYLTPGKSGINAVAGITTDKYPHILVVDSAGQVGITDTAFKKQNIAMKTKDPIIFVAGVGPKDSVFVTDGENWIRKTVADIGVKRPNSNGVKLLKGVITKVVVIPEGGELVANGEGVVGPDDAVRIREQDLFGVAPSNNWVVDQEASKKVMTLREVTQVAVNPGILHTSPLLR